VNVNIPGEIGGIIYKLIVSYIYSSDVYVVIVFRLIGKIVEIGLVNPPDIVNYNYYPNVVHGQPMRLNLIVKYDEVELTTVYTKLLDDIGNIELIIKLLLFATYT